MGPKLYRDLQSNATDIRNRFNEGFRQNNPMGNVVGTIFKPLKEEYFKTSPSGPDRFLFEAKMVCLYECISEKIKSRGFFSKLFHPIRTFKEKSCLNDFEKLLGKRKNPKRKKRIDKIDYKKIDKENYMRELEKENSISEKDFEKLLKTKVEEKYKETKNELSRSGEFNEGKDIDRNELEVQVKESLLHQYHVVPDFEDPFIKETKLVSVELSGGRFGFDISVENRKIYTTIERGAFLADGTLDGSNVNPFMNFKNRGFSLSAEDEELYNQITERNNRLKIEMEESAIQKEEIVEEFDDDEKSYIDLPVKEDEVAELD